jgi:hypothetical protein
MDHLAERLAAPVARATLTTPRASSADISAGLRDHRYLETNRPAARVSFPRLFALCSFSIPPGSWSSIQASTLGASRRRFFFLRGMTVLATLFSKVAAQIGRHHSDCINGGAQLRFSAGGLIAPVPDFPRLIDVDAKTVCEAAAVVTVWDGGQSELSEQGTPTRASAQEREVPSAYTGDEVRREHPEAMRVAGTHVVVELPKTGSEAP